MTKKEMIQAMLDGKILECKDAIGYYDEDHISPFRHEESNYNSTFTEWSSDWRIQGEAKPPSHEEIMTKWWKTEENSNNIWRKVVIYVPSDEEPYKIKYFDGYVGYSTKDFIGIESADIPLEA